MLSDITRSFRSRERRNRDIILQCISDAKGRHIGVSEFLSSVEKFR